MYSKNLNAVYFSFHLCLTVETKDLSGLIPQFCRLQHLELTFSKSKSYLHLPEVSASGCSFSKIIFNIILSLTGIQLLPKTRRYPQKMLQAPRLHHEEKKITPNG